VRAHVVWTEVLDERLRALRGARLTWDRVALEMGLGRNTVLERAGSVQGRSGRPCRWSRWRRATARHGPPAIRTPGG
jgi:hypothetical protein